MESKEEGEQPFPDSWISTTAPIALGALTDLSSEILFARGAEGAKVWRSTVGATYLRWCNGDITSWVPCEAVVRIATSELTRFMKRVTRNISTIAEKEDANSWANNLVEFYTEVMGRNLVIAKEMLDMILESKCPPALNNEPDTTPSPPVIEDSPTEAKEDPLSSPPQPSSPPKSKEDPPSSPPGAEEDTPSSPTSPSTPSKVEENPPEAEEDRPSSPLPPSSPTKAEQEPPSSPLSPSSPPKDKEDPPSSPPKATENSSSMDIEDENSPSSPFSEVTGGNVISAEESNESETSSSSESSNDESSSSSEVLAENWVSVESSHENEEPSEITEHSESKRESESESESSEDSSEESEESIESTHREDNDGIEEIKLAIGITKVDLLTMYPSTTEADKLPVETFAKLDERYNTPDSPDWMKLLPALKLRCVAAHYLQKILLSLREEELIGFVSHETVSNLLKILNASRDFAEDAAKNEDLAHAFQEAMFSEWGISEEMGEEALENIARLNHTQGSAMFFLTQTAGATNGVNRLLTALYDHEETFHGEDHWDRRFFAGQYLVAIMEDIFRKFAESETKEGHKVDPNVWRNSSESGVKVAIYCTSFASVVVGLLRAMLSFEPSLIERNKGVFYPLVCELVGVRSEEIRKLVRRVLAEKFGPMLGIGQDTGGKKPMRMSLDGDTDHGV